MIRFLALEGTCFCQGCKAPSTVIGIAVDWEGRVLQTFEWCEAHAAQAQADLQSRPDDEGLH
jgi:hypothetical protein